MCYCLFNKDATSKGMHFSLYKHKPSARSHKRKMTSELGGNPKHFCLPRLLVLQFQFHQVPLVRLSAPLCCSLNFLLPHIYCKAAATFDGYTLFGNEIWYCFKKGGGGEKRKREKKWGRERERTFKICLSVTYLRLSLHPCLIIIVQAVESWYFLRVPAPFFFLSLFLGLSQPGTMQKKGKHLV